jgi:hypothetical protein
MLQPCWIDLMSLYVAPLLRHAVLGKIDGGSNIRGIVLTNVPDYFARLCVELRFLDIDVEVGTIRVTRIRVFRVTL